MSASLVGSEMCIRDSRTPGPPDWRLRLDTSGVRGSASGLVSVLCDAGTCAVSYTHLTLPTICSV
eukprot:6674340-Alexandrium_andersonii.AAC.1